MLRGEPGIGKSALGSYAIERAEGMTVLTTRGVESELELPFAGLHGLLGPLLDRIASLPTLQAAALRGALALGPAVPGDRFGIYAATLALLASAAEEGGLLAVVDDAHLVDAGSMEAFLFASRRLGEEGVAMLFALRPDRHGGASDLDGFKLLDVGGLDIAATRELILEPVTGQLGNGLAERLHEATAGNPLALIELVRLLPPAQRSGAEPLADPLPAGARAAEAFGRRLEALPERTRSSLLVAASSQTGNLDLVTDALAQLGEDPAALEAAEVAGVISISEGRVEFTHPLARSAAYHGASPAARRAAHRAMARAARDKGSLSGRAWHLAAAALGPDEQAADALEQAGREGRARGAWPEAAKGGAADVRGRATPPAQRPLRPGAADRRTGAHVGRARRWKRARPRAHPRRRPGGARRGA